MELVQQKVPCCSGFGPFDRVSYAQFEQAEEVVEVHDVVVIPPYQGQHEAGLLAEGLGDVVVVQLSNPGGKLILCARRQPNALAESLPGFDDRAGSLCADSRREPL